MFLLPALLAALTDATILYVGLRGRHNESGDNDDSGNDSSNADDSSPAAATLFLHILLLFSAIRLIILIYPLSHHTLKGTRIPYQKVYYLFHGLSLCSAAASLIWLLIIAEEHSSSGGWGLHVDLEPDGLPVGLHPILKGRDGSTEEIGEVDWVLMCLKTHGLESAPALLKPLMGKDTRLLAIMNGFGIEEKLAEVVAGGRRTEKRRRSSAHAAAEVATRNAFGYTEGGKSVASSEQTNSGWSEDEEGRQMVIREYATRRQVVTESRRGYTVGAAWDEGNMIQAMAMAHHGHGRTLGHFGPKRGLIGFKIQQTN